MRNSNSSSILTNRTSTRSSCLKNYFDIIKELEQNKSHLLIDEPKKPFKKFSENIYDKYSTQIEAYVKHNKRSIYLSGSTKFGEIPIDSFIIELQKYKKTILQKIKENPRLMPMFNELEGDEIILTPLPEQTHRLMLDKKKERNDYDAAKRTAVVMRIAEYTHRFKRDKLPQSQLYKNLRKQPVKKMPSSNDDKTVILVMKNAIDRIEKWWLYLNKKSNQNNKGNEIQHKTFNEENTNQSMTYILHKIEKIKTHIYLTKAIYKNSLNDIDKIMYIQKKVRDCIILQRKVKKKSKKIIMIKKTLKKPKISIGYIHKKVYHIRKLIICQRAIKGYLKYLRIQKENNRHVDAYSIIVKRLFPIIITKDIKYICAADEFINNDEFLQKMIQKRPNQSLSISCSIQSNFHSHYNKSHHDTELSTINNALYSYYCHNFFYELRKLAKKPKMLRNILSRKTKQFLSNYIIQWNSIASIYTYTIFIQSTKAKNYAHKFHYKSKKIHKRDCSNVYYNIKAIEKIIRICKRKSMDALKEKHKNTKAKELIRLITMNHKRKGFYRLLLLQLMSYYEKNDKEGIKKIIQCGTEDNVLRRIQILRQLDIMNVKHKKKDMKYNIYIEHIIKEEDNEEKDEEEKEKQKEIEIEKQNQNEKKVKEQEIQIQKQIEIEINKQKQIKKDKEKEKEVIDNDNEKEIENNLKNSITSIKSNNSLVSNKVLNNQVLDKESRVLNLIQLTHSIKSFYSIKAEDQSHQSHKSFNSNHSVKYSQSHHSSESDIIIIPSNDSQYKQSTKSEHSSIHSEDEIIEADDYSDSSSKTIRESLNNDNAFKQKLPSEVLRIISSKSKQLCNNQHYLKTEEKNDVSTLSRNNCTYNKFFKEKSSVSVDRIRHIPYKPNPKAKGMTILLRDTHIIYHDNNI